MERNVGSLQIIFHLLKPGEKHMILIFPRTEIRSDRICKAFILG